MTSPTADDKLLGLFSATRHGVLATIAADGRPQMSNVLYVWDAAERTARISTTADRAKARNLQRDPRAALHVSGHHFWQYAVGEGDVTLSELATEPGDEATRELLATHTAHYGSLDEAKIHPQLIVTRRLVVRLYVRRVYGVYVDTLPGT